MFKNFLILLLGSAASFSGVLDLVNKTCQDLDLHVLLLSESKISEIIDQGLAEVERQGLDKIYYLEKLNSRIKAKMHTYELMINKKDRNQFLIRGLYATAFTLNLVGLGILFHKLFENEQSEFVKNADFLESNGVSFVESWVYVGHRFISHYRFTPSYDGLDYRTLSDIEKSKYILSKSSHSAGAWLMGEWVSFGAAAYTGFHALRNFYKWSPFGYKIKLKKYRLIQKKINKILDN